MSQGGLIRISDGNLPPDVPTTFVADIGTATPIANILNVLSSVVVAGSTPLQITGSGNTLTINLQRSQAIASTDATKIGLASFDSSGFNVDANGFVTLKSSGTALTNLTIDASTAPGTNPVLPNAGTITITGAQVASGIVGTNVIRTDSLSAGNIRIEVQRSTASASSTLANNGVCHFNSAQFTVDSNGFVSSTAAGASNTLTGNSGGPISPAAGNWNILGATVAAGTSPLVTSGAGSTITINAQRSQAIAATDSTKVGLSNFNSAQFTVDANGFVSLVAASSFTWSVITADQSAVAGNGYICNKAGLLTLTLPATSAIGDIIEVTGINTALGWKIAQNANQQIFFGNQSTTVGITGSLASTAIRDSIKIVCVVSGASSVFNVLGSVGNITIV
jgi:hypothetical protein